MPITILHTANGSLDAADRPLLDGLRDRLRASPKKVLLHLHGGLVSQKNGEAVAAALSGRGPYAFNAPDDYEQVYIVWRTGPFETIRINWQDLFNNDRLYRTLFKRLIAYVSGKSISNTADGRSVGMNAGLSQAEIERRMRSVEDAPFADLDAMVSIKADGRSITMQPATDQQVATEFALILQMSADFNDAVEDFAAAMEWEQGGRGGAAPLGNPGAGDLSLKRLSQDVREDLERASSTSEGRGLITSAALLKEVIAHSVKIAVRVIHRLRSGRGHGIHATIVEEIARELYGDRVGTTIWEMIKKDTSDHFANGMLGSAIVAMLAGSQHELVVTGHSAGAIWASAFMQAASKAAGFPKFKLALLAPAVRVTDFAAALSVASPLISSFRIFTMHEELERVDSVLGRGTGAIYPSSILYLVSGLFERNGGEPQPDAPLLGMERFIGRPPDWLNDDVEEAAVSAVRVYLANIGNSVVYSRSAGGAGLSTDATAHGDFDNNPLTLASVATFL